MRQNPDELQAAALSRARPLAAVAASPASPEEQALLLALPWLLRGHGAGGPASTVQHLLQRLPGCGLNDAMPLLQSAGLDLKMLAQPLAGLSADWLPVALLLNSGDACVLAERSGSGAQAVCTVVLPAADGDEVLRTSQAELAAEYSGVLLQVRPAPGAAQPAASPPAPQARAKRAAGLSLMVDDGDDEPSFDSRLPVVQAGAALPPTQAGRSLRQAVAQAAAGLRQGVHQLGEVGSQVGNRLGEVGSRLAAVAGAAGAAASHSAAALAGSLGHAAQAAAAAVASPAVPAPAGVDPHHQAAPTAADSPWWQRRPGEPRPLAAPAGRAEPVATPAPSPRPVLAQALAQRRQPGPRKPPPLHELPVLTEVLAEALAPAAAVWPTGAAQPLQGLRKGLARPRLQPEPLLAAQVGLAPAPVLLAEREPVARPRAAATAALDLADCAPRPLVAAPVAVTAAPAAVNAAGAVATAPLAPPPTLRSALPAPALPAEPGLAQPVAAGEAALQQPEAWPVLDFSLVDALLAADALVDGPAGSPRAAADPMAPRLVPGASPDGQARPRKPLRPGARQLGRPVARSQWCAPAQRTVASVTGARTFDSSLSGAVR